MNSLHPLWQLQEPESPPSLLSFSMTHSAVLGLVLTSHFIAHPPYFAIFKPGCRPLSLERLNAFANFAAPLYVRSWPALLCPRTTWEHNGFLTDVEGRFPYGSSSAGCPLILSPMPCYVFCSCKPHHHAAVLDYLSLSHAWARTLVLTAIFPLLPRLSAHAALAPLQHGAKQSHLLLYHWSS